VEAGAHAEWGGDEVAVTARGGGRGSRHVCGLARIAAVAPCGWWRDGGQGHALRLAAGWQLSGFARIARGRAGRTGGVFGVRGWRAVCGGKDSRGQVGEGRAEAGAVYALRLIVSRDNGGKDESARIFSSLFLSLARARLKTSPQGYEPTRAPGPGVTQKQHLRRWLVTSPPPLRGLCRWVVPIRIGSKCPNRCTVCAVTTLGSTPVRWRWRPALIIITTT
jgi:hypothetical protein